MKDSNWHETEDKRRRRGCVRVAVFILILAVILTVLVS